MRKFKMRESCMIGFCASRITTVFVSTEAELNHEITLTMRIFCCQMRIREGEEGIFRNNSHDLRRLRSPLSKGNKNFNNQLELHGHPKG